MNPHYQQGAVPYYGNAGSGGTIARAPVNHVPFRDEVMTVYVGKIPKTIPDELIRKFLECCGKLTQWTRAANPFSGEFNPFGYAKFASVVDVLVALRILNGYEMQGQKLLLKVDAKAQALCDSYQQQYGPPAMERDENIIRNIETHLQDFEALEEGADLDKDDPTMKAVPSVAGDREKATIVTSEIKRFREQQAQNEKDRQDRQQQVLVSLMEVDKERLKRRERKLRKLRDERMRDIEMDGRRKEREEREYREAERHWELREKDVEREKERIRQYRLEKAQKRELDIENENEDYATWRRHVKDSRRKRDRYREAEKDATDRELEKQEEERRIQALQREEQERKEREERERIEKEEREKREIERARGIQGSEIKKVDKSAVGPVAISLSTTIPKKRPLADILEDDGADDEAQPAQKKKRVLIKLDYAEVGHMTEEDKQRNPEMHESFVKALIEKIPVEKEALFSYSIDWEILHREGVIEKKVKPWLASKVTAYCGEDNVDLEKFVLQRLEEKCTAEELFSDVHLALGSETELFVKLLWRLLIFYQLSTSPAPTPAEKV